MIGRREGTIDLVFGLSKKLGKVPFPTVVKSTGFDVIPIDLHHSSDKMLIDSLNKIFKDFLKTSTEMNKQPLTVKKLPKTGYPDIEISRRPGSRFSGSV